MSDLEYLQGFGNEFASEAMTNILPQGVNTPQKVAKGLYAEQINGTSFTTKRDENARTWFYRIHPSVKHTPFETYNHKSWISDFQTPANPSQRRWGGITDTPEKQDFIDSLFTMCGNGSPMEWSGLAVHIYNATQSMDKRAFYNADGELLIVPQDGQMRFQTECGLLDVKPGEILVIPRGIKFSVELMEESAKGYICENYSAPLRLPDLGLIGSNGLANPRDFLYPVASYQNQRDDFELLAKFDGAVWSARMTHNPFDVVAWHGNYVPYKFNLDDFVALNTVSKDHPDPSIFTVLTSPSTIEGTANLDFVIFPPRWMVAEKTFRPPYFHRNIMSECMGLIKGIYDGKEAKTGGKDGFVPGGMSLHNCMSAHGPDARTTQRAIDAELKPVYIKGTMAFMFESRYVFKPTAQALTLDTLQEDYFKCWQDIEQTFEI